MSEERGRGIEQAAGKIAKEAKILSRKRPYRVIRLLHGELDNIRESYKKLVYSKNQITHAFEWLYDNYYVLEREGRLVVKELRRLEPVACGEGDMPVAYIYAGGLCQAARGAIDSESIERYIEQIQQVRCLDSLELSSFSLMLRAALIAGASRACDANIAEEERERLFSDAIKTLNFLTTFDFSQIVERQSRVEKILSNDPAGVYPHMDENSRDLYRTRIAKIARRRGMTEIEVAERAVELAAAAHGGRERHVGFYIIDNELEQAFRKTRGRLYLTLLWCAPAAVALLLGGLFRQIWLPFLLYIPLWEFTRPIVDFYILKGVPATFMPRLELEGIIPEDSPTLVVVSMLLTKPERIHDYVKKLEQFYYSNGHGSIQFGLLADLKESKLPEQPEDESAIRAAVKAVNRLNRRLGPHFCLFVRSRTMNKTQAAFSGWERKRGAIVELIRFIKGQPTSISTTEGDMSRVRQTRYVITLDADTGLLMDTAAEMVSVAMHPLNQPEVDEKEGKVARGYGILAPRMGVDLESAGKSPFSRIMAGCGGVTAYDNAAGDTYQDLFSEGIFAGKGLIDVDAFYKVLDNALPENRVLSHDILEGCFMRAGFVSDIELTDGFPPKPAPWFDRLHRWIRGDWQNLGYIGPHIHTGRGVVETPFNAISRFKLIDNLRRSLTPVLAFACMITACFTSFGLSLLLIAAAFVSMAGPGIWSAALAVAHGGFFMLSRKYHCRVLPQAVNSLAQGVLLYLFMPYHAVIACDGIVRALARQITGRKMLEWVTAAESEARNSGVRQSVRRFWLCTVVGVVFLVLAPSVPAKVAGALWIVSPFIAWLSGRTVPPRTEELNFDQTEKLRSYTAAMWRYYEDFALESDHFLPPDNVQEAPVHAVAHRTSPTNIGLCLLSTLAACDLKLIDSETLFQRVSATLSTMEKLEKWKGHLYNWYDTKTLRPLRPAYVSTVDSGNLVCCLLALREGLKEYPNPDRERLIDRITRLIDDCDLSALYNRRRKLFHIGYDVEEGCLSHIHYDLLMSEARMTSYYAVAKRIAAKKHWGALGRTLTKLNGYTGPISWTGTMFEYMMPHLLLPVYEDSLAAETLRFAIYCQKRRVRDKAIPWGISESGFYAFDAALNYQYEAHGVQKLALKRGMNSDLVISPYSTFIALPFDPGASMKNLERLESLGMYGRCGFYEAADFTFKRTGGQMAVVKSYMAHHVGMSIVASANALLDGIMQKRFMRDYEMRSAQELLQEKIPSNSVVFNDIILREVPNKPARWQFAKEEFSVMSPATPRVHAISNGEYTMVVSDVGASLSMFRGIDLIRRSGDLIRNPLGVYALASVGSETFSATVAPFYHSGDLTHRSAEFSSSGVTYTARATSAELTMHACLHGKIPCEVRHLELSNLSQKRAKAKLLLYFEPTLSKTADEAAHPAFSRLFLSAEYRSDTKILLFARRPRGGEQPAYLAVGFLELEVNFDFDTDRENLLSRPLGIASLDKAMFAEFHHETGALPEGAAALRVALELPAHGKKGCTLLIAAASTADEAAARLIEARRQGYASILHNTAGREGSDEMESRLASLILPQILFPVKDGASAGEAVNKNHMGQQGLWSMGISGDLPILLFDFTGTSDRERLELYVKTLRKLKLKGIQVDLAITYKESGDYTRALYGSIKEAIKACGCDNLIGGRGGIHLINLSNHPEEVYTLLQACACHIASPNLTAREPSQPYSLTDLLPGEPPAKTEPGEEKIAVYAGEFSDNAFVIPHREQSPPGPWCHILANPDFGTLLSDRALGYTWAINARENKLTPWSNDPLADNRGEMILLKIASRVYDLCLNARVTYTENEAKYETEIDGILCTVRVGVPGSMSAKVVELTIENGGGKSPEIEAAYFEEPVLSVNGTMRRLISIEPTQDMLLMNNPWAPVRGWGFLGVQGGMDGFATDRAAFLGGSWRQEGQINTPDPCAAVIVNRELPPRRREKITFVLGWAADREAAVKLAGMNSDGDHAKERTGNSILVTTPDRNLDVLINQWLSKQFLSSRIRGRTGFYQCGGAWGFRDQLQDICAAMLLYPQLAKAHIFRSAAHQFKEGDVMHWWHQIPPRDGGLRGVRTRCSDDMLWLPYAVCEYLDKTGDYELFKPEIHYLEGAELEPNEDDRYFMPGRSDEKGNVYQHCIRAVERAMRYGSHGIPLMQGGDWNDGMNLVGAAGRGESVWLAQFMALVLRRFAPVCRKMGDEAKGSQFEEEAARLLKTVDEACWDGDWYLRAFYDDGSPMGGKGSAECQIDSLPQSFAALSEMPDCERVKQALDSAIARLVDDRLRITKLFDPPFDGGSKDPGYIRSYTPGIRENGGQYTHAAVWLALALLKVGRADEAYKILSYINPVNRTQSEELAKIYRLEPYALAADIYSNRACEGRGGWSLYTGAAGWYYRTAVEFMLGIRIKSERVELHPVLPSGWEGYEANLNLRDSQIELKVKRGGDKLMVDGKPAEFIPLDGGQHKAELC